MKQKLKNLFSKIGKFFKTRWAYFAYLVCFWAVPIYLLSERVTLVKEVHAGIKITFIGCAVLLVLVFTFRNKIKEWIAGLKPGITRGILKVIHKGITYGLFIAILWGVSHFAGLFFEWWLYSGLSMLIGCIFLILDEWIQSKKGGE